MTKTPVTSVRCDVEFDCYVEGSVLAGTIKSTVSEFRTHLFINSPAEQPVIERLIRLAKSGCYAEQLVTRSTPLRSRYTVNGVEDYAFEVTS